MEPDSAARVLRMFYSEETSSGRGQLCKDVFGDKGEGETPCGGLAVWDQGYTSFRVKVEKLRLSAASG